MVIEIFDVEFSPESSVLRFPEPKKVVYKYHTCPLLVHILPKLVIRIKYVADGEM